MAPTLSIRPPRDIKIPPDDPWGFGVSGGGLVACTRDALEVAVVAADARAAREPAARQAVTPSREPPWPPSLTRPPAPPRRADEPGVSAPLPPRLRARPVFMAVAALVLSGTAGYLWFADGARWLRAESGAPGAAPGRGVFVLSSHPPGVEVLVDGVAAGVTPIALSLTAGSHTIVATAPTGITERFSAAVPAGESASRHLVLDAPPPAAASSPTPGADVVAAPAAPLPAFVTFEVPFDVRVYENGGFVGTGERLRVTPGRHTFTIVNEELGFRTEETVLAAAGRATRRVISRPSAPLSVNAEPWAEVFIGGRSLGETPLANVSLPVGTYQVTLRHPTLGERELAMTVRLGAPNRLAVDLRR